MICYCCYWCSTGTSAAGSRCTQSWGHRHAPSLVTGAWLQTDDGWGQSAWEPPATWAPAFAGGDDAQACGDTLPSVADGGPPSHIGEGGQQAGGSSVSMHLEGSRMFGQWGVVGRAFERAEGSGESVENTPAPLLVLPCGALTVGKSSCDKWSFAVCTAAREQLASAVDVPESSPPEAAMVSCSSSSAKVAVIRTSQAAAGDQSYQTSCLPCPSLPAAAVAAAVAAAAAAAAAAAGGKLPSCCSAHRAPSLSAEKSSGWLPLPPMSSGSLSHLVQALACLVSRLHPHWDPSSLNLPPCPPKFPWQGFVGPLYPPSEAPQARGLLASLSGVE